MIQHLSIGPLYRSVTHALPLIAHVGDLVAQLLSLRLYNTDLIYDEEIEVGSFEFVAQVTLPPIAGLGDRSMACTRAYDQGPSACSFLFCKY